MRFAPLDRNFTGISVPVAALRSGSGCGTGEFADLVALGRWCREAHLDLIQLLPVNDTGANSSPYSAQSAFALHPLYIRLADVPGADRFAEEIGQFREEAARHEKASGGRFSYGKTLGFKLSILERAFASDARRIRADPSFAQWRAANPWVVAYAVFTALKRENANAPWSAWPALSDPTPAQVQEWWEDHPAQCLARAWTQYLLEAQLAAASRALEGMGVLLKGDLPILMSRESADVWFERRLFDLSGIAGAPPDMFSPNGQNWGFPVYDWARLGRDDHRWWKDRLRQAGKFFHAFRIDHVLGFFRIWRIPQGEVTGLLGWFAPSAGLSRSDLASLGFDDARTQWLSLPHVSGAELDAALGGDASRVAALYLRRIGGEELYNIRPEYDSEAAVQALAEPPAMKAFLLAWHANRTLLDGGGDIWHPAWYWETRKGFQSLSDDEKRALQDLAHARRIQSEEGWEREGRALLAIMQGATDMLVCAEDLGDVPRCVPRVLAELGILGLRIVRWAREYEKTPPGEQAAFTPPDLFPRLSVCTPSVHDTSTLRGWWEEDAVERELYFRSLGETGPCPERMTPQLLSRIVAHCLSAASVLCMLQIQDVLDLDEGLWAADPRTDRINVPGTVTEENWTWRMPIDLESLAARDALRERVRLLVDPRRQRPAGGPA